MASRKSQEEQTPCSEDDALVSSSSTKEQLIAVFPRSFFDMHPKTGEPDTTFRIVGRTFSAQYLIEVAAIVQQSTDLETLSLFDIIVFGISGHQEAIGEIIGEMLRVNISLRELCVGCNYMSPSEISSITQGLQSNPKTVLTVLDISYNGDCGDKGAMACADLLRTNRTLKKLDLSFCNIGDGGAAALAGALEVNNTLEKLFLSSNKIGPWGAVRFVVALRSNKSLVELELERNAF